MKRAAFTLLLLVAACSFTALGIWQVDRLTWKRNLIAQVEKKLSSPAVPALPPRAWPQVNPSDAYTRVMAQGHYLPGKNAFVVASTRYGRGYWVLTPLETDQGFIVMVNRGFIAPQQKDAIKTPSGNVKVQGLLRLSEPRGSLLQANDPSQDRWFSRDTNALATHFRVGPAAPYFIDADSEGTSIPIGGLTVIQFRNHHLQYALVWFCLALLSLWSSWRIGFPAGRSATEG